MRQMFKKTRRIANPVQSNATIYALYCSRYNMKRHGHPIKRNKKLIFAGFAILIGGMCMRLAWIFIQDPLGPFIIITGAILFLGGVIFFINTMYKQRHRF